MKAKNALTLVLAAGVVAPAFAEDTHAMAPKGKVMQEMGGYVYFNIANGDRVVTLPNSRPVDNGVSPALWISDNWLPCASFGQTAGLIGGIVDCPAAVATCAGFGVTTLSSTGTLSVDWADVPANQVIDCVDIEYGTSHHDTDSDSDGFADGVPGLAAFWTFWDGNPTLADTNITPAGGVAFGNLPADAPPFAQFGVLYIFTVDLGPTSSSSSSFVFELGDDDSMAATPEVTFFNPMGFRDDDGDGNADFSYSIQFAQPGTIDTTGDGIIDGDPNNVAITTWLLATGNGTPTVDSSGNWDIVETTFPGNVGALEGFGSAFVDSLTSDVVFFGTNFWYGGFTCDADGNGTPSGNADYNPRADFYTVMYGPSANNEPMGCSPADIALPYDVLNFLDIQAFIGLYNAQDPAADFALPTGTWNFLDIQAYIGIYNQGCP